jgi:hypothetical protein
MNPFESKSIFVWEVPTLAGGDLGKIATFDPAVLIKLLTDGNFESVWLKCANGNGVFTLPTNPFKAWSGRPNVSRTLVDALHAAGFGVGGWGFCSGIDADGEGAIAASQVAALDLDGWIWDVEGDFEAWTDAHDPTLGKNRAGKLLGTYKKKIVKSVPTGLCSWAEWKDPTPGVNRPWHNQPMASFFMANATYSVNYFLPMCYWSRVDANGKPVPTTAGDATWLLGVAMAQAKAFTSSPIIPIGRAYTGDEGIVTPESMAAFDVAARAAGVKGLNWWSLDNAISITPTIMPTLAAMPKFNGPIVVPDPDPEPQPKTIEERLTAVEADVLAIKKKLGMI